MTHVVPATSTYATSAEPSCSTVTGLLSCGVSKVSNTTMPQKNSSSSYYSAGAVAKQEMCGGGASSSSDTMSGRIHVCEAELVPDVLLNI